MANTIMMTVTMAMLSGGYDDDAAMMMMRMTRIMAELTINILINPWYQVGSILLQNSMVRH
jgi:hypothetical protein